MESHATRATHNEGTCASRIEAPNGGFVVDF